MIGFILRIVVFVIALTSTIWLFTTGYWGWGIFMVFPLVIIGFTFFRNENMILALNQMRLGNTEKAQKYINRISAPQLLPKKQHAYVIFLQAEHCESGCHVRLTERDSQCETGTDEQDE